MDKKSDLSKILRQSHFAQSDALSWISGASMGFGIFLVPGLLIGVLITQSSTLFWVFLFFAIILALGAFLQWILNKSERKRFLKMAVENGVSKAEAEVFLENANWDEIFPEYD